MIEITDINYEPSINEISDYIGNSLFDEFYQYMNETYQSKCSIEFSKDVWVRGWNIKFRKSGRALSALYPKKHFFTILVVVGKKEKERVENQLPELSKKMQSIYQNTKEGNGQRWLMIDINQNDELYQDTLKLIRIRGESK